MSHICKDGQRHDVSEARCRVCDWSAPPQPQALAELLVRLRQLEQAATPGPWEHSEHAFNAPPYEGTLEHEHGIYPPLGERGPVAISNGSDNAALIVALRNALPLLLAHLEAGSTEAR